MATKTTVAAPEPQDDLSAAYAELGITDAPAGLTDGAMRCQVPGCNGIVKATWVGTTPNGKHFGRCPDATGHALLAKRDTTGRTQERVTMLARLYRFVGCPAKPAG